MKNQENPAVILSQCTPLCFLPSGKLVAYRLGEILVYFEDKIELRFRIFSEYKEKILGRINAFSRLLRLGVRASVALDDDNILVSKGNYIYEINLPAKTISKGFYCGTGIRPLIFTQVEGIPGFPDGIYFGGYLGNREMKPVSVYRRKGKDAWETVYTFQRGTINHIHNIVADTYRECLWIFTGDFGDASAIWKVKDNFEKVEYFVGGQQQYRGCVVFPLDQGLMYATDAPFADNSIYLFNPNDKSLRPVSPLHGSCIYGCKWRDNYVFSSTIEGDGRNTSRMEFYFGRKKGTGIKDDYIHMYSGNLEDGFKEIFQLKKDLMPFYTFQFGVFKFPYGDNNGHSLYFQPIASSKYDLKLLKY